jgi:hypothetical protein
MKVRARTRLADVLAYCSLPAVSCKVKKLKRLIGRSVVHGQHSGTGGVPVHFLGDLVCLVKRAAPAS